MSIIKKIAQSIFIIMITVFSTMLHAPEIDLDALPDHGFGFLERVRNETDYSINIYYDKHPTHDAMPEDSIVRMKNLSTGKYFTARKGDKGITFQADTTDSKDKATLFTVKHRLSGNLKSWLGFSHPMANNGMMSVDPETKLLVFKTKEADFLDEATKISHWEIIGSTIDACWLENRLTEGPLAPYTGSKEIKIEPDQEKIDAVQGVWAIRPSTLTYTNETLPNDGTTPFLFRSAQTNGFLYTRDDNYTNPDGNNPCDSRTWYSRYWSNYIRASNGNNWKASDGNSVKPLDQNTGDWEWVRFVANSNGSIKIVFGRRKNQVGFNQGDVVRCHFGGEHPSTNFFVDPTPFKTRNATIFGRTGESAANALAAAALHVLHPDANPNFWYGTLTRKSLSDITWDQRPTKAIQVCVHNNDDIWYIGEKGKLWHLTNEAKEIGAPSGVISVSVSARGDIWVVCDDNKPYIKTATGFSPAPTDGLKDDQIKQIAIKDSDKLTVAWGIGTDNQTYYLDTNALWKKISIPGADALWVSMAANGETWATDTQGRVWSYSYDAKKWQTIGCPTKLQQIAVKNRNDVLGISQGFNHELWHWDGSNWSQMPGKFNFVATASGQIITKILGKTEKQSFVAATTQTDDGKPLKFDDAFKIKFEIEKLGMGGGIPPLSAGDYVKIPVTQNPKVSGFAKDRIDNFDPSTLLNVNPLLTKGAAWLETSLVTPGKASVTFLARAADSGDVQVVFGQDISDNYCWRVIIGGWKNTKSAIVKRRFGPGGELIDDVVYEVTREQNPLAAVLPGNFSPYWVSLDDGLILVGMGDIGQNIFISWRDPNPPDYVNRIGFASHKQPVEYTQVVLGPSIAAQKPSRIYYPAKGVSTSESFSISPSTDSVSWFGHPFRVSDNGALTFDIQGQEKATLILASAENAKTDHYAISFNDTNEKGELGISINKWLQATRKPLLCSFLKKDTYPAIALDPKVWKKFWVSFYFGQIIIGYGSFGQNVLLVYQDLAPIANIHTIGAGAFGKTSFTVKNLQIAPAINISREKQTESYKRTQELVSFKGAVTFILPFEYRFSQQEQSVKLEDLVNNKVYYPGATPQQGALYAFMLTIIANGSPKMEWTTAPANPQEIKVKRELTKTTAAAEMERLKADITRKEGTIASGLKTAEGAKSRAEYEAQMGTANVMSSTGAQVAGMGSPIATGIGVGLIAGGFAYGVLAENRLKEAASKEYSGAEADAAAQRRALENESNAAQLEFKAKLLQGDANFAFRAHDSYVYVDKPERPELGSASIPQDAIDNKKELIDLLGQADAIVPTDDEKLQTLITLCQNMLFKINHYYVVNELEIKQRLWKNLDKVFNAPQASTMAADLISTLFSAYNNAFLANETQPDEAKKKDLWLIRINKLARTVLANNEDFTLDSYFGEYVWEPQALPNSTTFSVTFEASGMNDLFVCLSPDNTGKIRNSEKDVYEIVLGGWDNTKNALRIKSLDKSVKELTVDESPDAKLNPYDFEKFWISFNNGTISIGKGELGENSFLSWKDPYPIMNLHYIGFSSWNAPVSIKNIVLSAALTKPATVVDEEEIQEEPTDDEYTEPLLEEVTA